METENIQTAQRVVKNSIWLFATEILSKLLALGTQIVAARYLGDKGFGVFSFAFSVTGILLIFADSGINTFLTREIARHPERPEDYLANALILKTGLTLAVALVLALIPWVSSFDRETGLALWAIGLALLITGYADIYISVFRAFEKMRLVSLLAVTQRVLFFIFGITVLSLGYKVVPLAFAFLAASGINLFLVRWRFGVCYRSGKPAGTPENIIGIKEIFLQSMPLGMIILFTYIYFRIDAVMLYYLRGDAETGWYSAAFKLIEALLLLIDSTRNALFPLLSRTFGQENNQFQQIWRQATRYMFILGLAPALGTAFLAPRLIDMLYGNSYQTAGNTLRILGLALPLLLLNNLASNILISANKTGNILQAVSLGAVFNIALNCLLIPAWGSAGAASATCLTEILVFGLYYRSIKSVCGGINIVELMWRPVIGSAGMVLMLWTLFFLPLIPLIFLGSLTYLGLLIVLQTFNDQDRAVVRGILNRS